MFVLKLTPLAIFFFLATACSGAVPSTGKVAPPQPTNKPFYLNFNPVPGNRSTPTAITTSKIKVPVWSNKSTVTTTSPEATTEDANGDRPQYQCAYQGSFVVVCQELDKCLKIHNGTELILADNRTFGGYGCDAPVVRMQYSEKNGIATRGFINVLKQNTKSLDVLFVCHFFGHDLPAERSFTCSAPLDCRSRGALSPCSGGVPWYGLWTGDLELGLWGTITTEAMENG